MHTKCNMLVCLKFIKVLNCKTKTKIEGRRNIFIFEHCFLLLFWKRPHNGVRNKYIINNNKIFEHQCSLWTGCYSLYE